MNSIELKNVTKRLKGNTVLDDITFTFESGNIYGLYGRNASGKTMLLRAIAGLIYPNSGEVRIEGKILHKDISFPESMGIIIERTELLPQYTGMENLKILAKIKKIASVEDMRESLVRVKLDPDDKRKVHAYSLGMKQKLSIAQAIFEKPRIILLDELYIRFSPSTETFEFSEELFGGSVPKNYVPAVEKGLKKCMEKGPCREIGRASCRERV